MTETAPAPVGAAEEPRSVATDPDDRGPLPGRPRPLGALLRDARGAAARADLHARGLAKGVPLCLGPPAGRAPGCRAVLHLAPDPHPALPRIARGHLVATGRAAARPRARTVRPREHVAPLLGRLPRPRRPREASPTRHAALRLRLPALLPERPPDGAPGGGSLDVGGPFPAAVVLPRGPRAGRRARARDARRSPSRSSSSPCCSKGASTSSSGARCSSVCVGVFDRRKLRAVAEALVWAAALAALPPGAGLLPAGPQGPGLHLGRSEPRRSCGAGW